jgi:hypothetical protein
MIEFAFVTVKTGASVTHWVRYSSIISNSMAESVTSASFVLGLWVRINDRAATY